MKELSPAAQAVMDAYWQAPLSNEASVAAALRAAASQLTSAKSNDKLRAIADELEAMS